jgi:hypothetical protein
MSAEILDAGARHQHAEHAQVSSYKKLAICFQVNSWLAFSFQ